MKIVYNWLLPFPSFIATMLFGVIFARKKYKHLNWLVKHHEEIHKAQVIQDFKKQKEQCNWKAYIRFYWAYLKQVCKYGYNDAPFEREAKVYAPWPEYLDYRKPNAWKNFEI